MKMRIQRESRLGYSAREMQISIDGAVAGVLQNGEERTFDVPSGNHSLSFQIGGKTRGFASVTAADGDEVFVSCWCEPDGRIEIRSAHPGIQPQADTGNRNKTNSNVAILAIVLIGILLVAMIIALGCGSGSANGAVSSSQPTGGISDTTSTTPDNEEVNLSHPVSPGSVFDPGGYILFEGLHISYDGDVFAITSNRDDIIRISALVVGVKSDGSYEVLQYPAFSGPDETQYQKDLEENGWAVMEYTNMVRPGETLYAELSIFDFNAFDDSYPPADVDGDGYYDILFCVHPQRDEDSTITSTADPQSELYKLIAE